ncbi:carbohydrate-binding domain-containing protein [Heterostelium album PN500]|uniref:Carbohydrate-binding domain-containing protein n=1 Tax=Heterostelium pallidum (strain ATCC 26659 / Pp 5 / PN500) TaxID=670386 RepID=D3BGL4_HETP5|nr:carbohydrate-binding domain-containing protein [Heterostelium album PN500]EFA79248.1 carbohydrate-binding domain-containing protein [Heterostelium album PN500]|eukprot:XP_020431369.1 carbohydrate-binding domain-containing protein [Heterostelium album PN500]
MNWNTTRRNRYRILRNSRSKYFSILFLSTLQIENMKKRIIIKFYVQKKVEYGQYLKIAGSVPGLGYWNPEVGIEMKWTEGDWWIGEYHCEGLPSSLPKNQFRLEPSFGLMRSNSNQDNGIAADSNDNDNDDSDNDSASSTPTSSSAASSSSSSFHLNSNQSLSPILKGVSPQYIDIEYKYILYGNYQTNWESDRNHKVSFMLWSDPNSHSSSSDDIFIEIRDEWNGGNGVCPTLDFQSNQPILPMLDQQLQLNNYQQQQLQSTLTFNSYSYSSSPGGSSTASSSRLNSNNQYMMCEREYCFLHPLDPHPLPIYPAQICTFIVTDEGNTDCHSILLVSQFFGSDLQNSIQMIPIAQVGIPYTLWIGQLYAPQPIKFEYKYVIMSNNNSGIYWEKGTRIFSSSTQGPRLLINNDGPLRVSDASASWVRTGLVGLAESDNNCSLLSVVQLLYHISPLKQVLLKLRGRIGFPFTQCLANIFTTMEMGSQTTELNPLQTMIGHCSDSAEILNIILCSLIEEISRISKITNYEQNICINQIFEGDLSQTSVILDKQGNIESVKTHNEKFVNIILPVKGFISLEESLKVYQHNIEVFGNNTFETIITFENMPDIFIIQLDRTDYQPEHHRTVKVCDRFTFPKKFIPVNQTKYRIKGILCHTGSTQESYDNGHFYLYIRRRKQWFKCDGSNISYTSQKEAYHDSFGGNTDKQAYLLIYEKADGHYHNSHNNEETANSS